MRAFDILSLDEVVALPRDQILSSYSAVVQILGEDQGGFPDLHPVSLRLCFADFEDRRYDDAPSLKHVEEIVSFARGLSHGASVLFHCYAGVSRSAAAAMVVARAVLGPGSEAIIGDTILRQRPSAQPNELLIWLADHHLGCNGALIAQSNRLNAAGRQWARDHKKTGGWAW